jgi:Domain of unknown function (DUF4326)
VQLRRAKALAHACNTAQVDRSTLFANPFSVKEDGHDRAVAMHRAWLTGRSIGKVSKQLLQRKQGCAGDLTSTPPQEPGVLVSAP